MTTLDGLPMSPAQVRSVAHADARVNLWSGSIRSGKTIASLLAWLIYVARAPRGGELAVIGRTRQSIARNVFGPLTDPALFGDLARLVTYTSGADSAVILGRRVWVLGASDARAEAVLRGLTLAGAYVDEATLVAEPFWQQLLGRLSVPGARLFATTNPDAPGHWLKRSVIDRAGDLGYRVFRFRLSDNPYLDPTYVAQIMREYVGLWRRRFIDGEWTVAEGAVYDMWDPARHVLPAADVEALSLAGVVSLGVDYGTTHPTRGYLIGVTSPQGDQPARLVALAEWAPPTGLADVEQSAHLRRWLTQRPPAWQRPQWVPVDPAAKSFRVQLHNDGVTGLTNAHNDVTGGIRTLASLFATNRLVVSDACTELVRMLPGYSWDPKATAKGEDAVIKDGDDEVDALRYAIYSTRQVWLPLVPLTTALPAEPTDLPSHIDSAA